MKSLKMLYVIVLHMDDILGDIINNNVKVIIKNGKIVCYLTYNTFVTKKLNEISGIMLDLCKIIAEYYNAIIINDSTTLIFENEYINFKKVNCMMTLYQYTQNHWRFSNFYVTAPTILIDNKYQDRELTCLNLYLKKIYDVPGFFNNYTEDIYRDGIAVSHDEIIIERLKEQSIIYIVDEELFIFLMIVMKKIIEVLN